MKFISKISIVIPVFNAGRYLCDCIASLHCQTLRDVEFIFVDDASTDDGPDIIAGFAKKDKRVVFIQLPENVGSFMARKIGVEKVNSPYVTFLDPDDSLLPDACRLFVEKLDGTSADIVHGAMIVENKGNVSQKQDESRKYPNLVIGGRLGGYKYYDMDKSIASALEMAAAFA